MNLRNFFAELRRRRVYRVAIGYAIAGWLVVQIASTVLPTFQVPVWVLQALIVVVGLGFPVALVLAWAFDVTPSGIEKTPEGNADAATRNARAGWFLAAFGIAIAALVVGGYWFWHSGAGLAGRRALPAQKAADGIDGHPSDVRLPNDKSIAVLPFDNLSHDPENAYFADGIQDEILARLSKIADLKVISRTSTQRYKSAPSNLREIAQQLGVANILEGSVQKAGDAVRVNVQLINALNDAHLWAEIYDRKLNDIFAVESDISKVIADTLRAKLTGAEQHAIAAQPTASTTAYQLYLKGRFFWNKRTEADLKKALDYFSQAVAADHTYALAYAGIADVYTVLPSYSAIASKDCVPKAEAAAKKALELDNTLAEAHNSLASALSETQPFDFAQTEKEFKRAIELNSNYATAHQWYAEDVLLPTGRFDEALAGIKRAVELDPLSPIINAVLAQIYDAAGYYQQAIEQFQKTIELDPRWYAAHAWFADTLASHGDFETAIAEYVKAAQLGDDPTISTGLAWCYAGLGNKDEARKMVEQLGQRARHEYVPPHLFASAYLALGEKDEALRWLEKSYQDGEGGDLKLLRQDPRFQSLHGNPRYEKVVSLIFGS